jgi:nitroreductase
MRAPVVALCLVDPAMYRSRFGAQDKSSSTLGASDVDAWNVAYPTVDTAFSTMIVLLGAEAAGLGALFFHLQGRERLVLDGLGVPSRFEVIGAVALGHRGTEVGSTSPEKVPRRTTGERVHFEQHEGDS